MHVYSIGGDKKCFTFNGKKYRTPCTITVQSITQIDQLNQILKQNNIVDVKAYKNVIPKSNKTIHKAPVSKVNSRLVFSTKLNSTPLSR